MSPVQLVLFVVAWFCFVVSAFSTMVNLLKAAKLLMCRERGVEHFHVQRFLMFVAGTFALVGLWLYR